MSPGVLSSCAGASGDGSGVSRKCLTDSEILIMKSNRWIQQPKPNTHAALRLFCFPFAGGSAQSYRAWPEGLPSAVEVCPIQLPGRETRMRETPFNNVEPMLDELMPALHPYLDKPFVLFGHSMGAIIAFEVARKLHRAQLSLPECIIVSGRVAPHIPIPRPPIHSLPQAEFVDALKALNGTPKEVIENGALMELITPLLRADLAVHENYTYREEPPLPCDIVALGGLQDAEANRDAIEAWRRHTSGKFVRRMFPGDHFFIVNSQALFLRVLAQELYPITRKIRSRAADARQPISI